MHIILKKILNWGAWSFSSGNGFDHPCGKKEDGGAFCEVFDNQYAKDRRVTPGQRGQRLCKTAGFVVSSLCECTAFGAIVRIIADGHLHYRYICIAQGPCRHIQYFTGPLLASGAKDPRR